MMSNAPWRTAIGWLCLWGLIRGIAVADEQPAAAAKDLARIAGRIAWADGRSVDKATVSLHRWHRQRSRWLPSEQTAMPGTDGRFAFGDLPANQYWCVAVRDAGAGLALRQFGTEAGATAETSVTLRPAVSGWVTVRDDQGQPLAGAKLRSFEVVDGDEGKFYVSRGSETALGLMTAVSDAAGRLPLPPLPGGAVIKSARIDHPDLAAASIEARPIQPGETGDCVLKPGVRLRMDFVQPDGRSPVPELTEVMVRLYHEESRNPNSVTSVPYPVVEGRIEIVIEAGNYSMLRVEAEKFFITPQVLTENSGKPLRIVRGEYDRWMLRAFPKIPVRGRVIDGEGRPLAGRDLLGEALNVHSDGISVTEDWSKWCYTEWVETDERGEYLVHLAPGRSRVYYQGEGLPEIDELTLTVTNAADQRVPDLVVKPLPKIRGRVLGRDGKPAAQAIVRLISKTAVPGVVLPTFTDEQGSFEFSLPWMPVDWHTQKRVPVQQVFAYLPHASLGGVVPIDVRDADAAGRLTIRLTPQPSDWPLSAMRGSFTPWERGELDDQLEKKLNPAATVGGPVPELDGALWLNTNKRSLADFRGQYVFLDFYTTWCGPCDYDFPTVKMIQDLFGDRGVAVLGVHDNSSPHDLIREHARKKGMDMPIVVDHPDGHLVRAYLEAGLVSGYPGYVLLGPDGRLITADSAIPGPTLRCHKLERIRQLLLEHSTPQPE